MTDAYKVHCACGQELHQYGRDYNPGETILRVVPHDCPRKDEAPHDPANPSAER